MKISDAPFFKTTPPPPQFYQTPFLWEKSDPSPLNPPSLRKFQKLRPPLKFLSSFELL